MHRNIESTRSIISTCADETTKAAKDLASSLGRGDIVTLEGPLGAGKTTFTKGLISALTGADPSCIASPTFTYLNVYDGDIAIHHFDAYRIESEADFAEMGLGDFINSEVISIVEWPGKIPSYTKCSTVCVKIAYLEQDTREITITYSGL